MEALRIEFQKTQPKGKRWVIVGENSFDRILECRTRDQAENALEKLQRELVGQVRIAGDRPRVDREHDEEEQRPHHGDA